MPATEEAIAVREPAAPADVTAGIECMLAEARADEWQRVGPLAERLRGMIDRLPPAERAGAIRALAAGIERATALAVARRSEIGERLGAIRHGRRAAASYRANLDYRTP